MIQKNKNFTGRSMIEMLGVLAIIGVVSIGGVAMYKAAVNKHKANEVITDANLIAGLILTSNQVNSAEIGTALSFAEYKKLKSGFAFSSYKETDAIFSVNVLDVPEGVCKQILNGPPVSDLATAVNQNTYSDVPQDHECLENNMVTFYFDTANSVKCGGRICYGGRICRNKECTCPDRMVLQDDVCTCSDSYPIACHGGCYAECTGDGEFDCNVRACICPEPTHEERLVDNKCVCPTGAQEGTDGRCHVKACKNGTAGAKNWTCYIDDQRCGYQCTEDGLSCLYGICDLGQCPSETLHTYHTGMQVFGCKNTKGLTCTRINRESIVYCYPSDTATVPCGNGCDLKGTCAYGVCDSSLCPENTTYYAPTFTAGYSLTHGCWKKDGSVQCTVTSSTGTLTCATADGVICGRGCTYDTTCTGTPNFCPKANCQDYEIFDSEKQSCVAVCPAGTTHSVSGAYHRCTRSDGVFCRLENNDIIYCYLPNNKYCGYGCSLDGTDCYSGTCDASVCTDLSLTHQFITAAYAGCNNASTGIACHPVNHGNSIWCYKDNVRCTGTCTDYFGNGCCQTFTCPTGTTQTTYYYTSVYFNACYNSLHEVTCLSSHECLRNGLVCGTGCNLDGTECTSTFRKCVESECGEGKTLVLQNNAWSCQTTDVNCENDNCTINGAKCGQDCDADGYHCTYGVCNAGDCPNGTYLVKVDANTFGCKNNVGVSCYPENGRYTCSQGGSICATNCSMYTKDKLYSCATNTCAM